MVGHGERGDGAVGIQTLQGDVLALTHDFKTQRLQRPQHFGLGRIHREFGHDSDRGLGHEGFQHRLVHIQRLGAEGFQMEFDRRLHIVEGPLV